MKLLFYLLFSTYLPLTNPMLHKNFEIHEDISASVQLEIITSVKEVVLLYEENGDFWNEELGQLDDDKLLDFTAIFSGGALIFDDVSWSSEMLNYSAYAQLIFDNMKEIGLPFKLEEIKIRKLDIDETGFYIVDLEIKKRIFSALNENDLSVQLRRGRVVNLEMRIDFPDYLISDARIQYIKQTKNNSIVDYLKMPVEYIAQKIKKI